MMRFSTFLWAVAVLMLMTAPALAQENAGHAGMIKTVSGEARLQHQGAWLTPQPGMRITASDLLATGRNGHLGFILTDGTVITLGPESEFRIDAYVFEPEGNAFDFSFFMDKGTAICNTGKISRLSPESVNIQTPRATVGIRGTRFIVEVK